MKPHSSTVIPATARRACSSVRSSAADLVVIAAQGHFLVLEIVIGIARADGADRGLDLDAHELLVIVDVEQGLGGVDHAPHDLRRHFDRVAAQIVDLDPLGNEIVGAHRQLVAHQPRQDPAQARRAVGPGISAEQGDRRGLIGLQHVETDRRRSRTARRPPISATSSRSAGFSADHPSRRPSPRPARSTKQSQQHEIAARSSRRARSRLEVECNALDQSSSLSL